MVLIHAIIAITAGPMINNVSSGLNAAGDVKFTMYLSLVCTVIIRFAFSVFFCITLNLGAYGMILAIGMDWYSRMIAVHLRWRSMKWLK